ncbi:hypothetical protein N8T08_005602 [Aspergillus melleus]|uniref:Uncharacterized protein n=1 Tax=Aspergillus melleus TaxID=138277 RepID=A0ACC3B1R9_9EURO|nr:hypothetical protein N8T08_005602 [Aspergillus melleus]
MRKDRLFQGLGEQLGEITLNAIRPAEGEAVTKAGLQVLTSYNLLWKGSMVVPGFPPIWHPANAPKKVKPDKGTYLMDPARHWYPKFPLEPLFRALRITKPEMRLNNVDLITDRRNLRLLLDFVGGRTQKPFRIGVGVFKNTILFSCASDRRAMIRARNFQGHGYEFEKVYTRRPSLLNHSHTHHRVISYTIGDVRTVLRYEADGCTASGKGLSRQSIPSSSGKSSTGTQICKWGALVDPSQIIEIKTGPIRRRLNDAKTLEQLWLADTPILCSGRYDESGLFTDVTQENCLESGKLSEWEKGHQTKLQKLAALLRLIVNTAHSALWDECALVASEGRLKIFDLADQRGTALPIDLRSMWG